MNRYLQGAYVYGATPEAASTSKSNVWVMGIAGAIALLVALPYVEGSRPARHRAGASSTDRNTLVGRIRRKR